MCQSGAAIRSFEDVMKNQSYKTCMVEMLSHISLVQVHLLQVAKHMIALEQQLSEPVQLNKTEASL